MDVLVERKRQDWYAVEFATPRTLTGFDVYFFDDAPTGGCRPPASIRGPVLRRKNRAPGSPSSCSRSFPSDPKQGKTVSVSSRVRSARFRLVFRHAGRRFLHGSVRSQADRHAIQDGCDPTSTPLTIHRRQVHHADGYPVLGHPRAQPDRSGADDLCRPDHRQPARTSNHGRSAATPAVIADDRVRHLGSRAAVALAQVPAGPARGYPSIPIPLRCGAIYRRLSSGFAAVGQATSIPTVLREARELEDSLDKPTRPMAIRSSPGKPRSSRRSSSCGLAEEGSTVDSRARSGRTIGIYHQARGAGRARPARTPTSEEYQAWFDANVPYFDCSDPWLRKMYLPPGVRLAQEHAQPEARPDAMADAERRPVAEPLVSQRDQLWRRPPGPRSALASRSQILAGASAHLGREREEPTVCIPATSRPTGPPAASTPTGSPRPPGTDSSFTPT